MFYNFFSFLQCIIIHSYCIALQFEHIGVAISTYRANNAVLLESLWANTSCLKFHFLARLGFEWAIAKKVNKDIAFATFATASSDHSSSSNIRAIFTSSCFNLSNPQCNHSNCCRNKNELIHFGAK